MASETINFNLLANDRASGVFSRLGKNVGATESRLARVGRTMARVGKIAALGLAAGIGVAAVGMKKSIDAASDLNETMSKAEQIFGKKAVPALEKFGNAAATTLGQSKQAALDGASTFAIMGKSAGKSGKNLVDFSTELTSLAGDLASFHNSSPEEAITAIGSALRGENEPIRRFGVLLDDASLRAQALKMGLVETTRDALTPQQKVLAAHALILKQTGDAQGDFARTSGGLANQQRILRAQFDNVSASIGQNLLPFAVKVTTALNSLLEQMRSGEGVGGRFADAFRAVGGVITGTVLPRLRDLSTWIGENVIPKIQALGRWTRDDLAPALAQFARVVLPAVRAALDSIGRSLRDLGRTFGDGKGDARGFGNAVTTAITVAGPLVVAGLKMMALNIRILVEAFQAATAPLRFFARLAVNTVEGVRTAFKDADGIGVQFGRNLGLGMIRGLLGMAGAVMSAAGDLASRAVGAVRDKLKIFSPSKVMIELGEFFSKGFAGGIKKGAEVALKAASDLVEKVKGKLADLRSQAAQIRTGARDAVTGALDVGSLGAAGEDGAPAMRVTDQLGSFAAQAGQFAAALSSAAAKGLAPSLIAKVAGLGPTQGLTAAQALSALSSAEVSQANASIALAEKFAAQVGQTVITTTSLPADIARQEARLATLKEIRDDLRNNPREIKFVINDATDPDKVVAAIRRYIRRNGLLRNVTA